MGSTTSYGREKRTYVVWKYSTNQLSIPTFQKKGYVYRTKTQTMHPLKYSSVALQISPYEVPAHLAVETQPPTVVSDSEPRMVMLLHPARR